MQALQNFIIPLAAVFFDLYMYIVMPGMATWGQVTATDELWFRFYNPYSELTHEFRMPSIVSDIAGFLDRFGINEVLPQINDMNMFALFVTLIGITFFVIITFKLVRMMVAD